ELNIDNPQTWGAPNGSEVRIFRTFIENEEGKKWSDHVIRVERRSVQVDLTYAFTGGLWYVIATADVPVSRETDIQFDAYWEDSEGSHIESGTVRISAGQTTGQEPVFGIGSTGINEVAPTPQYFTTISVQK